MALSKSNLMSLRIFVIICLLGVLGWYAMNIVLAHQIAESKSQIDVAFPFGRLAYLAAPILASIWFTGNGKRLGFWIYAVFVLMFAGLQLVGVDAASIADERTELMFQFALLFLPLPLLHFALPLDRGNST